MHTKILLALALLAAHASAFSLAPSCAAPARQGAIALRASDAASVPLLGRRSLLAGTAAALPLVIGATPALARPKASDGKWAKHEGAFSAEELEGKPHLPRGILSRHFHPGGNPGANLKSISHRCCFFEVEFVWELTKETVQLPSGLPPGRCRTAMMQQLGQEGVRESAAEPGSPP